MTAASAMKQQAEDLWLPVEAVLREMKPTVTDEKLAFIRRHLERVACDASAEVASLDAETDAWNEFAERAGDLFHEMARPEKIDLDNPPNCPGVDLWFGVRQLLFYRYGARNLPEDPAGMAQAFEDAKRKHARAGGRHGQKQIRQKVMNYLAGLYLDWVGEPATAHNTSDWPDHPWSRLTAAACLWLDLGSPHRAAQKAASDMRKALGLLPSSGR
jgi:hypothetical protein